MGFSPLCGAGAKPGYMVIPGSSKKYLLVLQIWRCLSLCNVGIITLQNHRIVEVGKHLWRSPSPTPLLKAASATTGCPGPCPGVFWISSAMAMPQPLRATSSTVWQPSLWKSFFLCLTEFSVFQVVAVASCPSPDTPEKSLAPSSLPFPQIFIQLGKIPLSLHFSGPNSLSSLSLSSSDML